MSSTAAVKNSMADHWASLGASISAHTGDPGTTGANEVTGGGYARQTTTWGAASGGVTTGSQVTIPVPATTVTHTGRWNGSTFLGGVDTTDATITPAGELKVTPTYTYTGD